MTELEAAMVEWLKAKEYSDAAWKVYDKANTAATKALKRATTLTKRLQTSPIDKDDVDEPDLGGEGLTVALDVKSIDDVLSRVAISNSKWRVGPVSVKTDCIETTIPYELPPTKIEIPFDSRCEIPKAERYFYTFYNTSPKVISVRYRDNVYQVQPGNMIDIPIDDGAVLEFPASDVQYTCLGSVNGVTLPHPDQLDPPQHVADEPRRINFREFL